MAFSSDYYGYDHLLLSLKTHTKKKQQNLSADSILCVLIAYTPTIFKLGDNPAVVLHQCGRETENS